MASIKLQNCCSNCGIFGWEMWALGLGGLRHLCPDSAACGYRKFVQERHAGNLEPIFWGPLPAWMVQ